MRRHTYFDLAAVLFRSTINVEDLRHLVTAVGFSGGCAFANFASQVPSIAPMSKNRMRICVSFGLGILLIFGLMQARLMAARSTQENQAQRDRTAIERLHRRIIEATLSGQADQLTNLWDSDGVRLTRGGPPEIGKAKINADNKSDRAAHPEWKIMRYQPEVKDLQVSGDWAFEWGAFETAHKESATSSQVALHGQFLRVLKREVDGSWKIARVMLIESAK